MVTLIVENDDKERIKISSGPYPMTTIEVIAAPGAEPTESIVLSVDELEELVRLCQEAIRTIRTYKVS